MAIGKYNGMKRAKDWVGQPVTLARDVSNAYCALPRGYRGKITQQHSYGLTFEGEACGCCKVRPVVTRLNYFDVQLAV